MIKVLIVEDDPMVSKLHDVYMNQLDGFKLITIARSTDDALQVLEEKKIDLIVLDIFMPGTDGLALLKTIREKAYPVDVIVISAATDKEHILKALRLGASDYIIKPFEFERFSISLNSYKQRFDIFVNANTLKQEDIDTFLLNKKSMLTGKIPKGLEKNTLLNVWNAIIGFDDVFTTEEISAIVGISRVSIRKYLDFFKSINVLHLELNRGCVGRPIYKYKCINKNEGIIKSYVE